MHWPRMAEGTWGKRKENGEIARVGGHLRTITILPCIYTLYSIYHCEWVSWTAATVYSCVNNRDPMIIIPIFTNIAFTHATVGWLAQQARPVSWYQKRINRLACLYNHLSCCGLEEGALFAIETGWWMPSCCLQRVPANSQCLVRRTMTTIILIRITPCLCLRGMISWYLASSDL